MAKTANMPSFNDFKEATTVRAGGKVGFTKLGPVLSRDRLTVVDDALWNWWCIPHSQVDRKLGATLALMRACSAWAGKHQTSKGASRTGAQRMTAVQNVVQQSKLTLGELYKGSGKLKNLETDYRSERSNYKTAKNQGVKINPVGGSYIHGLKHDDLSELDPAIANILRKPMDQITEQEYDTIANALLPGNTREARTLYMDGSDRGAFALTVRGGVLCTLNGDPVTRDVVYAMDKYGSLYAASLDGAMTYAQGGHSTAFFNHSSFMAGKEVICAGTIQKLGWQTAAQYPQFANMTAVTTMSGHYKPTAANLKNCLLSLEASGLDLDRYLAEVSFPQHTVARASEFVRA